MFRVIAIVAALGAGTAHAQFSEWGEETNQDIVWSGAGGTGYDISTASWGEGVVEPGSTIFSTDVVMARTGRILESVDLQRMIGIRREYEEGYPVYAAMIRTRDGRELAWCIPRSGETSALLTSRTVCITRRNGRGRVHRMEPGERSFGLQERSTQRVERTRIPAISEQAVAFPPLYHDELRFLRLQDNQIVLERTLTRSGLEPETTELPLNLGEDGSFILRRSGGAWRMTPHGETDLEISVVSEPVDEREYISALRAYYAYLRVRTGGSQWTSQVPSSPSIVEMAANGFIPGETDPNSGGEMVGQPLAPPLGRLPGLAFAAPNTPGHLLLEREFDGVAALSGTLEHGAMIAVHRLRVSEIAVPRALIELPDGQSIAAGTPLGLVALGVTPADARPLQDPGSHVWCPLLQPDAVDQPIQCVRDADADGLFEQATQMYAYDPASAATLGRTGTRRAVTETPYDRMETGDGPYFEAGLRVCRLEDADHDAQADRETSATQWAFRADIRGPDRGWVALESICSETLEAANKPPGPAAETQFDIVVSQEDGISHYTINAPLEDGPVRLQRGAFFPDIAQGEAEAEDAPGAPDPAIRMIETPEVMTGFFEDRAPIVRVGVEYTMTGRLRNEIVDEEWLNTDRLPAGTPVFGVPIGVIDRYRPYGDRVVRRTMWCAPHAVSNGHEAVCLLPASRTYWEDSDDGYLPTDVHISYGAAVEAPDVEVGDVDFGYQLELRVTFLEWDARDAEVRVELCTRVECELAREISVARSGDGSAEAMIFGHHVRFTRPDGAGRRDVHVEILAGPSADYDPGIYGNLLVQALSHRSVFSMQSE